MKGLLLLLCFNAWGATVTSSTLCHVDDQTATGENSCSISYSYPPLPGEPIGDQGVFRAYTQTGVNFFDNQIDLRALSVVEELFSIPGGRRLLKQGDAEVTLSVQAFTDGPVRMGWARIEMIEAHDYQNVLGTFKTYGGSVAGITGLQWRHCGLSCIPPSFIPFYNIVPIQLGTAFDVSVRTTTSWRTFSGGQSAEAVMALFEDQALTIPVNVMDASVPEPGTWVVLLGIASLWFHGRYASRI